MNMQEYLGVIGVGFVAGLVLMVVSLFLGAITIIVTDFMNDMIHHETEYFTYRVPFLVRFVIVTIGLISVMYVLGLVVTSLWL